MNISCLKKKKSKQCCNKFDIEINKDISNKFKNVLGSKKVIIVLINCLLQKIILNNISLMHNIPLQYRIRNNTLTIDNTKNMNNNYSNHLHIFSLNKSNNDSKKKLNYQKIRLKRLK